MENLARHAAAEGRARAGAPHLAGAAPAQRADDGARSAIQLEVQDFIREMQAAHDSTILLCTHDLDEAEALAERVGILDRGRLLALEPADELKARFGAETLEEAFFSATGRGFEDEEDRSSTRRGRSQHGEPSRWSSSTS